MKDPYSISKHDITLTCDSLVIGSGPGGLIAAKRLIEEKHDTILIEEGDFVKTTESQHYKNYDKISRLWRNGGITTAFGKTSLLYAEGKAVGGGAEINSGIMQRAHSSIVDEWVEKNEINEFSKEDLDSYYEKVFNYVSPIHMSSHPSSDILSDAAKNLNWKSESLQTAYDSTGNKTSVSKIFLTQMLDDGLRLFSNLKAQKIKHKDGKAYEVECLSLGKYRVIVRFKNLFLAGGAICSPFLLLKSSIKKSVGKTLQFHPTLKVGALFNHKINTSPAVVPSCAITEFMPNIRIGGSIFTKGFFGMFLSEDWQRRKWLFNLHEYCGIYYAMIRPQGKAQIFKLPFLPDPIVLMKFSQSDKVLLSNALDKLVKAMFAAGAKFVYPSIYGHKGFENYEDIEVENFKNLNLMTIHMFSSLPMGEKDFCPVDSFGRLKEISNIIVCDASIIPSAPGTNPQATIMALVERNMNHFHSLSR